MLFQLPLFINNNMILYWVKVMFLPPQKLITQYKYHTEIWGSHGSEGLGVDHLGLYAM